jgi:hypothetical protein
MMRFLLILLMAAVPGISEDKVWSAVVLASKPAKGREAKQPPAELAAFSDKLTKVFGYDQFEILGSAMKAMDQQNERWLVPSQNFWVGARARKDGGNYHLNIEFFHDKRRIVETEAKLGVGSPLFIRGPMHPRGQLIVVFAVRN